MCDHVSPEMLDRYMDRVAALATDHPTYLWPPLYQSEVRARSEHLARVGRRLREEKEKADVNNQPHPYDPAKPFEHAWYELAVLEDRYWEKQFEKPADHIILKVAKLGEKLGGDAPVSSILRALADAPASSTHCDAVDSDSSPPATRQRRPKRKAVAMHAPGVPGVWKTRNNSGRELCKGFQRGTCTKVINGNCGKNAKHAHQFAICLDNRHGAEACPKKAGAGEDKGATRRKKRKASKQ